MTEPSEAELVRVVFWLPVVRVELVLVLEAAGRGGGVHPQSLRYREVGPSHGVVLGTGPLHGWNITRSVLCNNVHWAIFLEAHPSDH